MFVYQVDKIGLFLVGLTQTRDTWGKGTSIKELLFITLSYEHVYGTFSWSLINGGGFRPLLEGHPWTRRPELYKKVTEKVKGSKQVNSVPPFLVSFVEL